MKIKKLGMYLITGLLFTLLMIIPIYGENSVASDDDATISPYFLVENADTSIEQFPLKETSVTTNINGVIAETFVVQTYHNEGTTPINACYVFPTSTKVAVHGMKMEIGDKVVTAKIKEKQEAKQEFEESKEEGKSASLLEQERPNIFTMNVANVMPGDVVKIELHYTEWIVPTDGIYQFVFPTVVGPRYSKSNAEASSTENNGVSIPYLKEGRTDTGKYNINVHLSTGVPINTLDSTSHKIDIAWQDKTNADVTLANTKEFAGNKDFILNYTLTSEVIESGVMLYEGEDENFFMMMVQPPERYDETLLPSREYIFVLDVSGSMFGYPIETAKKLMYELVSKLNDGDSFNLILFSGGSKQLSENSLPATTENIQRAYDLIDAQDAGGGTELLPALQTALNIPRTTNQARSVVLITDGYVDCEKEAFQLIRQNLDNTNFFSFGIGDGVNRYLVEGIAKAGQGESFVVTNAFQANSVAEKFRQYIEAPILTDIQLTYDGFDAYDVIPEKIPTLFAQRPIVVFGKWKGTPEGTIRLTGNQGNKPYAQNIQVTGSTDENKNTALPFIWARTKVEQLMDYGVNDYQEDSVKKEVTQLGLKYSLMTPYTSFIAIIDTIRNGEKKSTDVVQPLPLPSGVSNFAVGDGYTVGSEPETLLMIGGATIFLVLNRNKKKAP